MYYIYSRFKTKTGKLRKYSTNTAYHDQQPYFLQTVMWFFDIVPRSKLTALFFIPGSKSLYNPGGKSL